MVLSVSSEVHAGRTPSPPTLLSSALASRCETYACKTGVRLEDVIELYCGGWSGRGACAGRVTLGLRASIPLVWNRQIAS